MKIPAKYQVFAEPVVLLDKDVDRFEPYLSCWTYLHVLLTLGVNEPDLRRLIVMELCGRRRKHILTRLLMRLGRVQRHSLERKINQLLK